MIDVFYLIFQKGRVREINQILRTNSCPEKKIVTFYNVEKKPEGNKDYSLGDSEFIKGRISTP